MIEKQCKNFNKPLPDFLLKKRAKKRPKLAFGLDFFYEAFWNLCTERVFNEVILNIAWSKIQEYADYWEMDFEESEQFHYLMKKMDDAYVKNMRKKGKKDNKNNGKTEQDESIEPRKPTNQRAKQNKSK